MPVLYFISSFEGTILLVKNYKIQLPVFCLLFSVSIYSSRCHFLIRFYRFIHPYLKNIFVAYFPLFADSPKLPYNPNNQNPLSVRNFFCECFLSKLWWFYWTLIWRPVRGRERVLFKLAYNFYTFICSKDNIFTRNVNINDLYMLLITKIILITSLKFDVSLFTGTLKDSFYIWKAPLFYRGISCKLLHIMEILMSVWYIDR